MTDKRKTTIIPKAPLIRLIMHAGAERVSKSAAGELSTILMEKGLLISNKAAKLAKHAGRKTVHEEDIKLAAKER